jgi:hypothetical protein
LVRRPVSGGAERGAAELALLHGANVTPARAAAERGV